jgi:hypothetical protein
MSNPCGAAFTMQIGSPADLSMLTWLTLTTQFEQHFNTAVGSEHLMRQFGVHTNHQRI